MKKVTTLFLLLINCSLFAYDAFIEGVAYEFNNYDMTAEVVALNVVPGFMTAAPNKEEVVIPSTITFRGVSYKVTSIGEAAFADHKKLHSITINDGVTCIKNEAFSGCKNLKNVVLPSTLTVIDNRAFTFCTDLRSIMIPEKCDYLGDYAFAWSGLISITIGSHIKSVGKKVLYKCALEKVYYPKGSDVSNLDIPRAANLIAYDADHSPYRISSNVTNQNYTQLPSTPTKTTPVFKSTVDTNIPATDASNPNTFAIIFANEDYKNVASVPFAKNDGAVFQKYCQKTLGIPTSNIHYVENASFNDIRIQLAWLKDVCDAFDGNASVIIYYAGHGIPDEETRSAYLLPVDGDGRYVQSAYKLDEFYQKLGAMKAKTVTIFMDACFSGSKREEGMLVAARGVALAPRKGVPQGNMVVFSAAQGDETAYPNNDEQHGIFTYYLLKKLQETKGDVTLLDLGDYIITNVRQQSIVKNGKIQTPCVIPSTSVGNAWQTWKLR